MVGFGKPNRRGMVLRLAEPGPDGYMNRTPISPFGKLNSSDKQPKRIAIEEDAIEYAITPVNPVF